MACVGNRRCCCCVALGVQTLLEWSGNRDFSIARDLTAYAGWDPRLEANYKRSQFWRIVYDLDDQVYAMGAIRNGRMYRIWEPPTLRLDVDLGQGNPGYIAGFTGFDDNDLDDLWYWKGGTNPPHDFRLEVGTSRCGCGKAVWPDGCDLMDADELRYVYYEGDEDDPLIVSDRCPPEVLFFRHRKNVISLGVTYPARYETASGTFGRRTTTRVEYGTGIGTAPSEDFSAALFETAKCVIVSRPSGQNATWSASALKAWLDTGNKVLVIDPLTAIQNAPASNAVGGLPQTAYHPGDDFWGFPSITKLAIQVGSGIALATTTTFWSQLGIQTGVDYFDPATDFPAVNPVTFFNEITQQNQTYDSWFNMIGAAATVYLGGSGANARVTYSNLSTGPAMEGVTIGSAYNSPAIQEANLPLYSNYKLTPAAGAETLANVTFSLVEKSDWHPLAPWDTGSYAFPGIVLERVGESYVLLVSGLDHQRGTVSGEDLGCDPSRVGFAVGLPDRLLQNVLAMAEAL